MRAVLTSLSLLLAIAASNALADDQEDALIDAGRVDIKWGLKIQLRDGVELTANLYYPRDSPGTPNCIVTLTPYVAEQYHNRGMYFAAHGYAFVVVDARGRGGSGGVFRPFIEEANDGYDVVEWLSKQPFCAGPIGMWGGSYAGYDQWATAKARPPHLGTIVPVAAPLLGIDFPLQDNIYTPYDVQWLIYTSGHTLQPQIFSDQAFWATRFLEWTQSGEPFRTFDERLRFPSSIFQEWVSHPYPDAYWDAYNPTTEDYARLQIPVLTITGSYDDDQLGALTHYRRYMQAAGPAARDRSYLVIGPWDHLGTRTPKLEFGGIRVGPASLLDLPRLHVAWYDWTLKGKEAPQFLRAHVAYYVMGSDQWCYADNLEGITTRTVPYYLASDGAAADPVHAGELVPDGHPHGSPDRYVYDPNDKATAAIESRTDPNDLTDQRILNTFPGRRLVYYTPVFERDAVLAGTLRLSAWLAIDRADTDFLAQVFEVFADGRSILLSADAFRARYRADARMPHLVDTTAPLRYEFTQFNFIARTIGRGSRLRLVIGPVDSIYSERNYNSPRPVADQTAADARVVEVHAYHDIRHPSALYVPISEPACRQ